MKTASPAVCPAKGQLPRLSRRALLGAGVALMGLGILPQAFAAPTGPAYRVGEGARALRVRLGGRWLRPGRDFELTGDEGGMLRLLERPAGWGDGAGDRDGELLSLYYQDGVGSWHERHVRV